MRKNVINLFKESGFKIETEANLKIVNLLDVTFNLANSTNRPYKAPTEFHRKKNYLIAPPTSMSLIQPNQNMKKL